MFHRAIESIWAALLGLGVVCAVVQVDPPTARAAQCASFSADSGNNVIILGEATNWFWYMGNKVYYGLGYLSICWTNSSGTPTYSTFFGQCDTSTSASDHVYVQALAGDDTIFPNARTDTDCTLGNRMWPFDESVFAFWLTADGGTGKDKIFGTEHGDLLRSNVSGMIPNLTPADSAADEICGYGGNDSLYGDRDDTNTYEEILHGGSGTGDVCNGGYDGNTYDWLHTSCETRYYGSATSVDLTPCGAAPPDLWW